MSGAPPSTPAPTRWVSASIERVVHQTPRAVSVFVRAPLTEHVAGQHVDVRLTADDGYQAQRSYSIASAPGAAALELVIERLPDGEVSPYFHEAAQPGDTFDLRGPLGGHFVWRAADGGPLLLVGGGSGVVPLMSIAREHAARASTAPALLVYSARTWDDIIFRDELARLATQHPDRLTVVHTLTREENTSLFGTSVRKGRVNAALLREAIPTPGECDVYVCGPGISKFDVAAAKERGETPQPRFLESVLADLAAIGVPKNRIKREFYG